MPLQGMATDTPTCHRKDTMAHRLHALSLAACVACAPSLAQEAQEPTPTTALERVTITGRARDAADVTGFGQPLARTPMQATALAESDWRDIGAQRLADITRLDAAVSDSYNATGYWDFLSVRGFTLDNRYNFRRDGLPINAETVIPLANKSALELLKGASGIQAGTSAPGGLVNYIVKRPARTLRSATVDARSDASVGAQVDISQRFGTEESFGARVNLGANRLAPPLNNARGKQHLVALAADWRASLHTLLEAEVEISHQSQPSQPGFSLLGNRVPAPADPRINLNNQPWSQPVVFDGTTASLRWQHRLAADWQLVAHAATQRLATDDRVAFPFGCSAENNFDRYCSDGTFDLYDFRSENERRRTDALDVSLRGRGAWAGMAHELAAGMLHSRFKTGFARQAFNFADIGNIDGTLVTPPAPDLTADSANRRERSSELYLRDAVQLAGAWQAWLGLRATRLSRESTLTNGAPQTPPYRRSLTTPWVALSHEFAPQQFVYASWGRGVELEAAPNQPRLANAGQALPPSRSRQVELGAKGSRDGLDWSVAAFDIRRPQTAVVPAGAGPCDDTPASCVLAFDGSARHRGIEGGAGIEHGPWTVSASAMWLRARREGSADDAVNGRRPSNVPARSLKAGASHRAAALPGLALSAAIVHEGERMVLPNDGSLRIPSWTRLDLGASYRHQQGDAVLTWRAGVDNAADRRAWREAPTQFGHVYLFPLTGRTWRLSLQAEL
jgi:iron complex outermembrane recepter protein